MTNCEIIAQACALKNIVEPVHTYARWREMGYQVVRGSKALFDVQLWRYKANAQALENDDEVEPSGRCFLTKAYLFGASQVMPIA